MVVLVDNTLDETPRTVCIDLGIPDQSPDSGVIGVAERTTDLLAADESSDANLFLRHLQFSVALERVDEIPAIEIQNDCRGVLRFGLTECRHKIRRPERNHRLADDVDFLRLRSLDQRLGTGFSIDGGCSDHMPAG